MIHLLVAYRRSSQGLLESKQFAADDLRLALAERARLDRQYWGDSDIEVVILTGESLDRMRETHGRYFLSGAQLTERLSNSARASQHLRRGHTLQPA
jgi:hypothetical protein